MEFILFITYSEFQIELNSSTFLFLLFLFSQLLYDNFQGGESSKVSTPCSHTNTRQVSILLSEISYWLQLAMSFISISYNNSMEMYNVYLLTGWL